MGTERATEETKQCPTCSDTLRVLLFLDVQPDGYVCERCKVWFDDELKPLAQVM
jgi:hypothetical protein